MWMGASSVEELKVLLKNAGSSSIKIDIKDVSSKYASKWSISLQVEEYIKSASIEAIKKSM